MNPHNDLSADDWLDRALEEHAQEHRAVHIPDDGFTARVTAALPPVATLPAWRKPALALLWAVAAGGVAIALPDAAMSALREIASVVGGIPVSLTGIAAGVGILTAATWTAAAVALRQE